MAPRAIALLLAASLAAMSPAHAQFKWRDEAGRMVYSDRAPPPSVPASAILRQPAAPASGTTPAIAPSAAATPAIPSAAAATQAAPSATSGAPSTADREMAYRKRRLEREQGERKNEENQARERQVAAACEDARAEVRTMSSGERIMRIDERGERVVLDDAVRGERLQAARRAASEHCKPG